MQNRDVYLPSAVKREARLILSNCGTCSAMGIQHPVPIRGVFSQTISFKYPPPLPPQFGFAQGGALAEVVVRAVLLAWSRDGGAQR